MRSRSYDTPVISTPAVLFAPNDVDSEIVAGIGAAMADIVASPEFADTVNAKGTLAIYAAGAEAEAKLRAMQAAAQ